jgi:CBS domain-containing protein
MKISEIMAGEVVVVSPETKITEVAKILHEKNFHGLPVVDGGRLVGIVTETDFFTKGDNNIYLPDYVSFLSELKTDDANIREDKNGKFAKLLDASAGDIMSKDCITLHPDSDIKIMCMLIREAGIHSAPVVTEDGRLVGIVTQADILKLI